MPLSNEEAKECLRIEEQQEDADAEMDRIYDIIGISTDGWMLDGMYENAVVYV
jgi:hypothetical protein